MAWSAATYPAGPAPDAGRQAPPSTGARRRVCSIHGRARDGLGDAVDWSFVGEITIDTAPKETAEPQNFGEKQHELAMRTYGLPFVRMVLDAMYSDQVTVADVSDFLDMKLDHLNDLEQAVAASLSV